MSNTAYIRDIASLEQLRIAIARFCEESENQLQAIDSKLQSRIGNLKSLKSQFQTMIETAQDELRSANGSLSSCEANTDEDEEGNTTYPNCDSEQEDVIDCRKRLELAEHNYNSFKLEIRNLEKSIAEYQNPKVKYRTLIQFESPSRPPHGRGALHALVRAGHGREIRQNGSWLHLLCKFAWW